MTKNTETTYSNKKSNVPYPEGFLTNAFEEMRNKLLDISGGRSRLLNLNQDTRGFVRVVDELPDQLAKHLLASKLFTMDSVNDPTRAELIEHGYLVWDKEEDNYVACKPMPKAREWANIKGIKVDYDLPSDSLHAEDNRHQNSNIQTVMFDSALSTTMKKLSSQAKTSIEETGNNILFLSLGFLEWTDKIRGKERQAPLYMIPVKIEKTVFNNVVRYGIKFTGEDIIANLTLYEKLSQDFEVELPSIFDLADEDNILSPEEYFSKVESLLAMKAGDATMSNWRLRRFATLATLSLGRLLMYRDLDPLRWPEGKENLIAHDFIRKFFSDDRSDESSSSSDDGNNAHHKNYILDNVPLLHDKFPMVEDADSSQMSALIDILNGTSMVIEGPPGTGKSQTITNLISAAISQGKSVLFVAEKQAALDVVKRRMDKAGLGDFCLDLHSDKAQKRMVLDSYNKRIQFAGRHQFKSTDYDDQVQRYEGSRERLQEYCLMINKNWKNTGFTIHEILCAATRYAKDVAPLTYAEISPENISGEDFTRIKLDSQLEQLELFFEYLNIVGQQLPEIGNWQSHPWCGVNNKFISGSDGHQLHIQLNDWTTKLKTIDENLKKVFDKYGIANEGLLTLDELEKWVEELCQIKSLSKNEYLPAFKKIHRDQLDFLNNCVQIAHDTSHSFQELGSIFNQTLLSDFKEIGRIRNSIKNIEALGVSKEVQFDDLARSIKQFERAISLAQSIENKRNELMPHLCATEKIDLKGLFAITSSGFTELALFIDHVVALPAELLNYRDDIYDAETLPPIFSEIKKLQGTLLDKNERLSKLFKLDRTPDVATIKEQAAIMSRTGFLSVFDSVWRQTRKDILAYSVHEKIAKKTITASLIDLASWQESCGLFKNSIAYKTALGPEFKGIDTNLNRIETLMNWYQSVRKDYGIGFGARTVIAKTLFTLNKDIFRGVQQLHKDGVNDQISEFKTNLSNLATIFKNLGCVTDLDFTISPQAEPLERCLSDISISLESIQKYLINPNLEQKILLNALSQLERVVAASDAFERENLSDKFFDGTLDLGLNSNGSLPKDIYIVESTMSYLSNIYDMVTNEELLSLLTQRITEVTVADLITISISLSEDKKNALFSERAVMASIESDREQWSKGSGLGVDALCKRNQLAINSIEWLDGWTKYLHAKDRMQEGGQGKLKDYFDDSQPTLEYGKQVMNFAVFTCLANEVYKQQSGLSDRSGHEQTAIQNQFKKYDDGLKDIQRCRVAHLALQRKIDRGSSGAKVSSYTGDLLLRHEIAKKSRHIAIRKLVERAGDAMLGYKPCFMMSPMAVAKYLPPGKLKFDLVIMDEASQVKPEFALSCFARGRQAIVVGDPKQLPPTSFFERSTSNESMEDDDLGVINDSESILEAIGSHYPKRMLQWHYRSRHESLIDFSNRHFYNSELVVFPSPWAQSAEFGIKFNYIENGVFVSGINNEEAKHIVEAIKYHVLNNEDESLGIVAMNSKQREQIEMLLDLKRLDDPILDAGLKRDAKTEDPIFIKNLENVQGDERDVIIISFTYGPQNRGAKSVPQRFGPINSEQGWRRLNVLFTRSKKRIQVYSSMRASNIILSDSSKRGVGALKNYLSYAESGELIDQTGSSQGVPDSDFEIAVIKQLAAAGYECVPQVGVAGFKIDVGVRDPGMLGRYLMGIECDGATYHSSKSTRDRDRVRQGVLEGLGWNIKRIWSTDWFKNPDAELKPILDDLKRMATPISELPIQLEVEHKDTFDLKSNLSDTDQFEADKQDAQETLEFDVSSDDKSLKSRLENFNTRIIEKEFPNTPAAKRLLRAEMLEMLDSERPVNLEDFSELIPNYLRTHTSVEEASKFLGDVLEMIAVYEELYD